MLAFAVTFVAPHWADIVASLRRMSWPALAGSLGFALAGLVAAELSWRRVLAGLGSPLPHLAAGRVYFLSQLGKYVPGSIWPVVAQAELSRAYGVPRSRAAAAAVAQLLVGVVTGAVVAGVALSTTSSGALRTYWWLALVAVAGAAALVPPVFDRVLAATLRLLRRGPAAPLGARALAATAGWELVMWAAFGAHLWLLALGIGTRHPGLPLLATGAYALAWLVGLLVVVLPAGAGAREAALVLALAPALGRVDALALALVSRAVMLAADGLSAAAAVAAERSYRRLTAGTGSP